MKPLLKGLIITLVTVAVVIPAGYYAVTSFQQANISLAQVVPGNSTLVIAGTYNNTPAYIYNTSSTSGVVLGVDLTDLSTQISSATNNSGGVHPVVQPSLYHTYRGYNVYQIRNVSLEGLIPQNISGLTAEYNLTLNVTKYVQNDTIYVADFSNVVSLGSYNSVVATINTLLDKTGFQNFAGKYFNSTANVSFYLNSSSLPVRQAIINVFYERSTFNLEFNNTGTATNATLIMSGLPQLVKNYTYFPSYALDGTWVNGTMAIGIGNYYLLQYILDSLSTYNLSNIISGQIP